MAQSAQQARSPIIGLGGLTFLILLILKLTAAPTITWFWVFFPLWIGAAIVIGIWLIAVIVIGIGAFFVWLLS